MKIGWKLICISLSIITILLVSFIPVLYSSEEAINIQRDFVELDNGLKVVLLRDPASKTVSITLAVKFGSAYDQKGKDGLAHYTFMVSNRMIQEQYRRFYTDILSRDGAMYLPEFGTDTASFTTTCSRDDLDTVLTMEAQRLAVDTVDPMEFEAVKRLKMAEFMKNSFEKPDIFLKYSLRAPIRYNWEYSHYYEGKQTDVQIARIQDVERFFTWYYSPSNASLVIRGPIDREHVLSKIRDTFGIIKKSEKQPLTYKAYSISLEPTKMLYKNEELEEPAVSFSFAIPAITEKSYTSARTLFHMLFSGKKSIIGEFADKSKTVVNYYSTISDHGGPNYAGCICYLPSELYYDSMIDYFKEQAGLLRKGTVDAARLKNNLDVLRKDLKRSLDYDNYTSTIAKFLLVFEKPKDINDYFNSFQNVSRESVIDAINKYLQDGNSSIIRYSK